MNGGRLCVLHVGMLPPEVGGALTGGIATHLWELAVEGAKRGHEVHVLGNTRASLVRDGVCIHAWPERSAARKIGDALGQLVGGAGFGQGAPMSLSQRLSGLSGAAVLDGLVERIGPDLVHVHSFRNAVAVALLFRSRRVPVVLTEYGLGVVFEERLQSAFRRGGGAEDPKLVGAVAGAVDQLLSISQFARELLLKHFEIPAELPVRVILLPTRIERLPLLEREPLRRELGLPADRKVVLFVGPAQPVSRKGLDILLAAFASAEPLRRRCQLVVITNDEGQAFARDAPRFGELEARLLPLQPWEKLVEYYNAADVFAMPSRKEAFGLVYTEALAVGTPVVGYHRSVREIGDALGTDIGEPFDPTREDAGALAGKILAVLERSYARDSLRKCLEDELSWGPGIEKFVAVYREVLARKNADA